MSAFPRAQFLLVAGLALAWPLIHPSAAEAGLAAAISWRQTSPDQQYVLVMVAPVPAEKDGIHPAWVEEVRAIRASYQVSGLYRNDGSASPMWAMQYVGPGEAFVSPDGKHVVLYSTDWHYGYVASFFESGTELETYYLDDLWEAMPSMKWKHLVRSADSPAGEFQFDAAAQLCSLRTKAGEVFVFDLTTGQIVRSATPWPTYFGIAIGVPVFAFAAAGALLVVWRARQDRAQVVAG